jgi:hypothetical protein
MINNFYKKIYIFNNNLLLKISKIKFIIFIISTLCL